MKLRLSHLDAGQGHDASADVHPPRGTVQSLAPSEKRLSSGALFVFLAGSFMAHGVAYAALAGLPASPGPGQDDVEIEFAIVQPVAEPPAPVAKEPEPVVVPPKPQPAKPKPAVAAPKPEVAEASPPAVEQPVAEPVAEASPAPLTIGTSTEGGLSVAAQVGAGSGPSAAGGKGTSAPAPVRTVDLGPIAKEWTRRVEAAIRAQASRDYPRSALRAKLQGSVLLAVKVDTKGHLASVEVTRSSGHSLLDEAALAAAKALGDLPAPPEALHGYLRPIQIPINYRVQ